MGCSSKISTLYILGSSLKRDISKRFFYYYYWFMPSALLCVPKDGTDDLLTSDWSIKSHSIDNRCWFPIRWVNNAADLTRPLCNGLQNDSRTRKVTPWQFNLSELMPSKKRANKYPNDDKFSWSMYVENFVHNVPARGS